MGLTVWIAAAAVAIRFAADGEALERLKSRDPKAIRALVDRHHGSLVALAHSVVKNRSVAEEIAQETWIAVIGSIDGFDGRSMLSTWIISILLNKAKTHARREGRYVPLSAEPDDGDVRAVDPARFAADGHWTDPPSGFDGLDPERVFAGRELWRHVRDAIDHLPPAQRAVVILRDVEGRSAEEAATLLDLSRENQRVLLHRARAKLRQVVEDLERRAGAGLTQA